MSNAIYKKDLRDVALAVAQGSKNYTDKTKEEIYWHIGDYSISTQADNTTASTKAVPSGATRCKIKKIYGLTEKFNPSVAYDNASTMTKTMPNVVYDFDCSVVYGNSEVSENLIVLSDVPQTTYNGLTYKVENGVITVISGTAESNFAIYLSLKQNINLIANANYKIALFNPNYVATTDYVGLYINGSTVVGITHTTSANMTKDVSVTENMVSSQFCVRFTGGSTYSNFVIKPMLVSGSTAPTEFKVGFEGIHNLELSGLKVEGENIVNQQDRATSTWKGITYNCENGKATYKGTAEENTDLFLPSFTLPKGTYSFNIFRSSDFGVGFTYSYSGGTAQYNSFTSDTKTITFTDTVTCQFYMHFNANVNVNYEFYIMAKYGSTAPTTFVPYIAPTTKTIDLSTILYNGSPLFEGNSLKGYGGVNDELTPYKATKKLGYVDLSQCNWTYHSGYHFWISSDIASLINKSSYTQSAVPTNILCDKYIPTSNNVLQQEQPSGYITIYYDNGNILLNNGSDTTTPSGYLVFELATPIEVSIDWSAILRNIQGYSNGTITLQNTYNMDTANTITYNSIIKENCCAKIVQSRGGNVVKTINLTNDDVEYGYSSTNENNVRDYTTNVGTINVGKRAYQSGDEEDTDVITDMEYTYYPLTTPTTESLTAIENIIEVQPNDVLSFYDSNDNLVTVPSDITYRIEVERV